MDEDNNVNKVFLRLNDRVDNLEKRVENLEHKPDVPIKEEWMDGKAVMRALNISKRTLQTIRDTGRLIPSRILKKYYYKVSDIKQLLSDNYVRYHKNRTI